MKTYRIVLTGGGTGGHIFPIVAVGAELQRLAKERGVRLRLYYVGPTTGPIDIDPSIFENQGIEVRSIAAARAADSPISSVLRPFLFLKGFFQSLAHLYLIMPDIIFSKGGYGAIPVIAAAIFYRIPFFIHDSDAIPGRANMMSARFAKRIAVAFSEAAKFFPAEKTAVTGNPIQRVFVSGRSRSDALKYFKLDGSRKTLLVVGGSQGAKPLNDILLDTLPTLLEDYQVIHQCGARNFGEVKREAEFVLHGIKDNKAEDYKLFGFLSPEELADAYEASDLVISRAGAGEIFEIAARAKPAILIPFKHAAQGHQRANAYAYADTGAARVVEEENLTPHIFVDEIKKILNDAGVMAEMSESAKLFAKPDAAEMIAKELLRSIGVPIV